MRCRSRCCTGPTDLTRTACRPIWLDEPLSNRPPPESGCCPPHAAARPQAPPSRDPPRGEPRLHGMVTIPAGSFRMGGDDPEVWSGDAEGPVRPVDLPAFMIDATAVTNEAFAGFVGSTGYRTEAEQFGWSFVFHKALHPDARHHVMPSAVGGA